MRSRLSATVAGVAALGLTAAMVSACGSSNSGGSGAKKTEELIVGTKRLGDAEGHWFFTVLLFVPRWPLALPIIVLAPIAAFGRLKPVSLGALAIGALLLLWFNDVGVSLGSGGDAPRAERLRIMTYNIGGGSFEPSDLVALVRDLDVDVAGLQECQLEEGVFSGTGYSQRNDNGNCLVTRLPIKTVDVRDPQEIWDKNGSGAIARYELEWSGKVFDLEIVHLETVREGLQTLPFGFWKSDWEGPKQLDENVSERAMESRVASEWVRRGTAPTLVIGDFNMPPDSAIYRTYWSGFHNALSEKTLGRRVTKETRWHGIRIDHVLFDDRLQCIGARVTRHLGMDHRPVVADFRFVAP